MATTTVEKVKIEIGVTTKDAEERIKKLTGQMNSLQKQMDSNKAKSHTTFSGLGSSASSASKKVSGLADSLKKVNNYTKKFFSAIALSPFRAFGNGLSGITSKASTFFASIKRIAMYRLLRTALKMFSQGLKEGMQNLYYFSQMMGTQFSKSLDSMATTALYVKNTLATIAEPIINVVAPVLDMLADKFAALAAKVAEFIAALTGQGTYSKALKYPIQYAEAAEDAAKAMQKWLAPFDEINRLTAANSSGSNASLDYKNMFETIMVDSEGVIAKLANQLKESLKNGNFSSFTAQLGEKLAAALRGIKWDDIKKQCESVADTIGTSITSFITAPDLTESIGTSLAEMLNAGITFLFTLKETLDFNAMGEALGNGINSFLSTFDWNKFVGTVEGWFTGIVTFLTSLIKTTGWDEFGKKIGEAIKSIDWVAAFKAVGNLGWTIINALFDTIGGAIDELLGTKSGVGKQIAEVLAVTTLTTKFGLLLAKILPINTAYSEKNRLLQQQTGETNAETNAVAKLAAKFQTMATPTTVLTTLLGTLGGALGGVAVLNGAVSSTMDDVKDSAGKSTDALNQYTKAAENAAKVTPVSGAAATSGVVGKAGLAVGAALAAGAMYSGGSTLNKLLNDKDLAVAGFSVRAGGGFVKSGEAFISRENGMPEMVGRIGNRTAVANNDQIVAGISEGVADANTDVVNAIYAMAGQIVSAIRSNGNSGSVDWDGVARKITRVQMRQAVSANA